MIKKMKVWMLICLGICIAFPGSVWAGKQEKVKIGYYTAENFQEGGSDDAYKTGYGYEYIQKVADYTGWQYDYVYGSWDDLYAQLVNGEIDVMAGISYSDERSELISYPDYEMLNETFYIYKDVDDTSIKSGNLRSYAGKKVGVLADNIKMTTALQKWLDDKHADITVVAYDSLEACADAFGKKQIDAFVSADNIVSSYTGIVPVEKIGKEPYYFCVAKKRQDLLNSLNMALAVIDEQDAIDLDEIRNKYSAESTVSVFLSRQERDWMNAHPSITVGYVKNYMPYSDAGSDGKAKGLIADVVPDLFAALPGGYEPDIIYKCYDSQREMLDGLKNGETDFIFPVSDERWYSEQQGYQQSSAVVASPIALAYRKSYGPSSTDRIAVNERNLLQYCYTVVNYPDAELIKCNSSEECVQAVSDGQADGTLVSALRGNYLTGHQKQMNLLTLSADDKLCFGVDYGNSDLLQILNHGINILGDAYGLNHTYPYIDGMTRYTASDFVQDNMEFVAAAVLAAVFIIVLYFMQKERNQRRIAERELQQNQQLEEALTIARKAEMARQIFLRNMSHDIRTPMNAVIGFTNLAIQAGEAHSERVQDYLHKILSSSQYLLGIVNEVLEISRIESGQTQLNEGCCDITELVSEVDNIIRGQAEERHQKFEVDMTGVQNQHIYCDKLRVKEIMVNLLGNSVKFTPEGGQISLKLLQLPCEEQGYGLYELHVKDNGCGMRPEFLEKVFQPFEREANPTVGSIQGTGLGMPIVKGFVDMMGGTIQILSEEGAGTEVIIRLRHRLAEQTDIRTLSKSGSEINGTFSFKGKRLLLAEDNILNREIASAILTEAGLDIEVAENGAEAVEKVTEKPSGYYDAVLMDIQMPVMDGYTATQRIRSLEDKAIADIPIIAVSANAFEEDKRQSFEVGMNGHLAKPINVSDLMAVLGEILRS